MNGASLTDPRMLVVVSCTLGVASFSYLDANCGGYNYNITHIDTWSFVVPLRHVVYQELSCHGPRFLAWNNAERRYILPFVFVGGHGCAGYTLSVDPGTYLSSCSQRDREMSFSSG